MTDPAAKPSTARRLVISVRGVVQGVGFRPFVFNAARSRGLVGWVQNDADAVRIEVQGATADLDAFLDTLRRANPPQAHIESIDVGETNCRWGSEETFQIRATLDAYEGDARIFARSWDEVVPRNLV